MWKLFMPSRRHLSEKDRAYGSLNFEQKRFWENSLQHLQKHQRKYDAIPTLALEEDTAA